MFGFPLCYGNRLTYRYHILQRRLSLFRGPTFVFVLLGLWDIGACRGLAVELKGIIRWKCLWSEGNRESREVPVGRDSVGCLGDHVNAHLGRMTIRSQ